MAKKKKKLDLDVSDEQMKTPTEFYHVVILDKSGSMSGVRDVTLAGLNTNIEGIKKDADENPEQKHYFCLVTFSYHNQIDFVRWMMPHDKVMPLAKEDYMPNGGTALLDAIGISINKLKNDIEPKLKDGSAVALITIMTDGDENSSQEFKHADIEKMTKELQEGDETPWTITYIGSAPTAQATAAAMGISNQNFAAYDNTQAGTHAVFDSLAFSRSSYTKKMKDSGRVLRNSKSFFSPEDDINSKVNLSADIDHLMGNPPGTKSVKT